MLKKKTSSKTVAIPAGTTEWQLHDAVIYTISGRAADGIKALKVSKAKFEKLAIIGRDLALNSANCFFCKEKVPEQRKVTGRVTQAKKWEVFVACQCFEKRVAEVLPLSVKKVHAKTKKPAKPAYWSNDPSAIKVMADLTAGIIQRHTVVHSGECITKGPGCLKKYRVTAGTVAQQIKDHRLTPETYRWTHACVECARQTRSARTGISHAAPMNRAVETLDAPEVELLPAGTRNDVDTLRVPLKEVLGAKETA